MNDDCSRETLGLIAATGISGDRVMRDLDAPVRLHGKPESIVTGTGTECTSKAVLKWARDNGVAWDCIDPGKPQQNAFIESVNGSLRDECRTAEIIDSQADARRTRALWRHDDDTARPHSSPGGVTPAEARRALA